MSRLYLLLFRLLLVVFIFGLDGCASIRTMPSLASQTQPTIYSGTRLDYYAIANDEYYLKKFNAQAPKHPLVDFPFSAILDTVILPVTIPIASYWLLRERGW